MTVVTLDFETRSEADLLKVGAWAYSEHPSTEIICVSWAVGDGPVSNWANPEVDPMVRSAASPPDLLGLAVDFRVLFEAHGATFEYAIWTNICVARWGWPPVALRRMRDTMAVACYYSMPPALDNLCRALGLPGKDPEGKRLITKYSKLHLKTAKRDIPPEDMDKWLRYCDSDVDKERQVGTILGELPERELEYFLNDLEVNSRGLLLDQEGIFAAKVVVDMRSKDLEEEFRALVGLNPGQVKEIGKWVQECDHLGLPDLRAATIDELLDEGRIGDEPVERVHPTVRRALELRRQWARASTKKLDAMLRHRGKDGTAKFQTRFHGALTGRNTGLGIQPLNLAKSMEGVDPEQLVRDIHVGDPAWLDCLYGDAMEAVGKASRHWIVAPPGHRLMVGDFSSVEAVINAGLAGEEWKLDLFRRGEDPYCAFASRALRREVLPKKHPDVTVQDLKDRQRVGKPGELAFGYQGAVGAWRKFDRSLAFSDTEIVEFVRSWRDLHPAIERQWEELGEAAFEAVANPGKVTGFYNEEWFERVDGWLTMILPDGKRLWYWAPELRMGWPPWHRPDLDEDCTALECDCKKRLQVTYLAQKEGQWRRVHTYGGKLCENRVQAVSRQLLKPTELRLRDAGYKQVLGVYDEAVCVVPNGWGDAEEFRQIMEADLPDYARDWPIRAGVWEGQRYKKE